MAWKFIRRQRASQALRLVVHPHNAVMDHIASALIIAAPVLVTVVWRNGCDRHSRNRPGGKLEDLKNREVKFVPTEDEVAAMRGIDSAAALGQSTATVPEISKRLFEFGYVGKDEHGQLVLTVKGKRLLRMANYQG